MDKLSKKMDNFLNFSIQNSFIHLLSTRQKNGVFFQFWGEGKAWRQLFKAVFSPSKKAACLL
jgi:hypothetical protein